MATTNATAPKSAPKVKKESQGFQGIKAGWAVIVACAVIAVCIYLFVFGSAGNFKGDIGAPFACMSDAEAMEPAGLVGTVYMGGFVVPIIWTLLFTVIALSVERGIALNVANGKGKLAKFVAEVKKAVTSGDLQKAQQLCDKQQGVVGNVVTASLKAYAEMEQATGLKKEQKVAKIQQAHEEAVQLEMPTLQMNMPILATLVTLGTLTALFGTVVGMIKSFAALAAGGGGDSLELSTGISEALVNTASGILTSWCAVVAYNFYSNKIDKLTYALDEVGYTIAKTYEANHTEEA